MATQHFTTSSTSTYQSYTSRWIMLFLFVMYSTSNAFQWTQLVIITNILEKYYQVETIYVSWTSMIFMATYIPLIFPATWFLQKKVSTIEIWGVNGLNKSNRMDKIEINILTLHFGFLHFAKCESKSTLLKFSFFNSNKLLSSWLLEDGKTYICG